MHTADVFARMLRKQRLTGEFSLSHSCREESAELQHWKVSYAGRRFSATRKEKENSEGGGGAILAHFSSIKRPLFYVYYTSSLKEN